MIKNITPAAFAAKNKADFLAAITPGGIEAQEAAGQIELVNSTVLPKDILHGSTKADFEKMGIKFLDDADDIFVNVELPIGWKKQATSHSMWSDLIDEKDRKRATIFYKAAFYDRYAHISVTNRFSVSCYDPAGCETRHYRTVVKDCDNVIFDAGVSAEDDWERIELLRRIATAWLTEKYPEWQNPMAYWD